MLHRLLPLAGAAGATALFAIMGAAPASAQRCDGPYFTIQYGPTYHRTYRDCDRDYVYVAPPRREYYHRDWDRDRDHERWDRDRDHDRRDRDRDRGDHHHRR